ncbi:hypothetical protein SMALB_7509 [Streptomyces malaysiensis]|uniref:Uncharacterized protein n=1 Tax=Streptomyces malaysiensis TaxID=92644 RepID=A0A7X5XCF1_STRMQ|nr:hypothetical protein [Streptomyces malaysiensis]
MSRACLPRLSCFLSAAGVSFLGILSRQRIRPLLRSAYRYTRPLRPYRTLAGFPCSACVRCGWGWVSSIPRGRWYPHDQNQSLVATCRLSTTGPFHFVIHAATKRWNYEASARIHWYSPHTQPSHRLWSPGGTETLGLSPELHTRLSRTQSRMSG